MSLFDLFRGVFGFTSGRGLNRNTDMPDEIPHEFRIPIWDFNDDETLSENNINWGIESNPFGIHKFFERQMGQVLQSIGLSGSLIEPPCFRSLPQFSEENSPSQRSLRDECLKPSSEVPSNGIWKNRSMFSDFEEQGSAEDAGKLLQSPLSPRRFDNNMTPHLYFSTVTGQTINRLDGDVEIHHSICDSQGYKEVTVTRIRNGRAYSVDKKCFSDDKEELI